MYGEMANGMLFIPALSVHQTLKKMMANQSLTPTHIPWEEWANGTSWVNTRSLRPSANCVIGHRAALLSFDHNERGWRVLLYDLRANIRGCKAEDFLKNEGEALRRSDKYLNGVFTNAGTGIREPAVMRSFLISEDEEWNVHTDSIPPVLGIDDERGE
jgi:hypothetical protein